MFKTKSQNEFKMNNNNPSQNALTLIDLIEKCRTFMES